jgi:hypothetical protein
MLSFRSGMWTTWPTKPETWASKSAKEMTDAELRAGGVGSCVLRFFGFPDFVTGL